MGTRKRQTCTVRTSEQCSAMTEAGRTPEETAKRDSVQEYGTEISLLAAVKPPRVGNGVISEPLCRKNHIQAGVNPVEEIRL